MSNNVFDNEKMNNVFGGESGSSFPNNIKTFTPQNAIPGVHGGLNTPKSATITPISQYVPTGMAPRVDPPPMDDGGAIVNQKQDGIIDSGNNLPVFNFKFNGHPAGGGSRGEAISDQKQAGSVSGTGIQNPLGKPF